MTFLLKSICFLQAVRFIIAANPSGLNATPVLGEFAGEAKREFNPGRYILTSTLRHLTLLSRAEQFG